MEGTSEELLHELQLYPKEQRFKLVLIPTNPKPVENVGTRQRDPELVARVKSIRGKYAHLGVSVEDLHREREADRQRDEQHMPGESS